MNKYKAGGRCGGSSTKETGCSPSAQLSALLAARAAQDAAFSGSLVHSEAQGQKQPEQAIQVKKTQPQQQTKSNDIDLILGGDLD